MKIINIVKLLNCFIVLVLFLTFGRTVSAADTNYTYTNQEQDKSGLMHYDSRYYDPDLGRFLQPDPFDVPNKYAYVSNDPVNYTDPTGNEGVPTADQYYDSSYLFNQNSYTFSSIADPFNTDTYLNIWGDSSTIDNNIIVGDMVGIGEIQDSDITGSTKLKKSITLSGFLNAVQVVLAGAGMTEPFGFVFDCIDGCISLARGNADMFTAMAIVPVIGEVAGTGKMIKLVEMPDKVKLDPNTLVEWIKDKHGLPSDWSGGNNYALLFSEHWKEQRLMLQQFEGFGIKGQSMMMTTAQEFLDAMQKYYKHRGMSEEAIKRMTGR